MSIKKGFDKKSFLFSLCLCFMLQKYFIAIVPPVSVLEKLTAIKHTIANSYNIKGALLSPAHITLHMPFTWEDGKEEKLLLSLNEFSHNQTVKIKLTHFDCFEPRVVFVSVENTTELQKLQSQLVKYCKQHLHLYNQAEDMRGFHPHITVAFRDLKKATFNVLWQKHQYELFDAAFDSQSFCLLKKQGQFWEVYKEFMFVK